MYVTIEKCCIESNVLCMSTGVRLYTIRK